MLMKYLLLNFLCRFTFLLPLPRLISFTEQNLFLPFYHAVQGKDELPHIRHLYLPRTQSQFEQDLDYLLNYFNPITLQEVYEVITGRKQLQRPSFHLTFDDGLREVFEIVAPILKRKGIPATIFVNSGFVDNQGLFFRYKVSLLIEKINSGTISNNLATKINQTVNSFSPKQLLALGYQDQIVIDQIAQLLELNFDDFLLEQKPYLTTKQIRFLQADGFTIGAHSVDHPQYNEITLEEQLEQTKESVRFIAKHFNPRFNCFSFPFTDDGVSQKFFTEINEKKITQLTFGCAGLKQDGAPYHLQRFPMEGTKEPAEKLIKTEYTYYLVKSLFNKNQIIRS